VTSRVLRWAVVLVRLDPTEGHEQAGQRPVLVVSFEPLHQLGVMTVVPITSSRTVPRLPNDVVLPIGEAGLTRPGILICSQVRTISVLRIVTERVAAGGLHYVTSPTIRQQVREALAHHFGLDMRPGLDGAEGAASFHERNGG
jgi:mRNA interferase MazF